MKQEIYEDPYRVVDWDLGHRSRCFVHVANSAAWTAITGELPPTAPPTAGQYNKCGLPWFDYYDADLKALEGAEGLQALKSIARMSAEKAETVLTDNAPLETKHIVTVKRDRSKNLVREGRFQQHVSFRRSRGKVHFRTLVLFL